ncbi:hypothetical protein BC938DRAFT_483206 [Jimgerdemannia flammicorona]|uniref:Uncharacterized protein n=1 Tax=Jimgerdemannia flammicorona TaxID=994334 RepID=A0A433QCH3_9FUNG|nr:hypothetical protein BC938DRAFT_483206 [Jimgerdemannia flammicorona]
MVFAGIFGSKELKAFDGRAEGLRSSERPVEDRRGRGNRAADVDEEICEFGWAQAKDGLESGESGDVVAFVCATREVDHDPFHLIWIIEPAMTGLGWQLGNAPCFLDAVAETVEEEVSALAKQRTGFLIPGRTGQCADEQIQG